MLPISLRPNGRRAVIIGGGDVAARKARALAVAGFPIFIVAERIGQRLQSLAENGGAYAQRRYEPDDVTGAALVVVATDDDELNARVVADARAAGALVCDATHPERGDFTMVATARLGDLTIAVDSQGHAPAFARRVARELSEALGAPYTQAVRTLARMRSYVKESFPETQRAEILRALAQRPIAELATPPHKAVCATRRSELAMVQSRWVAARLAERAIETSLLGVTTAGDRDRTTPIERLGETNVFVKELENALREGRADYAVHSCKDLPGALPGDMRIAAISQRADARDAFCSERFESFDLLPAGAVVGTSSPRRRAQLAARRPELRYQPLRGNVDTRLRKLRAGEYDAIVLAMAGLERLGARATHVVPFSVEELVPAVGQGALAVETRAGDDRLLDALRDAVNDSESELCVSCEREALRAMRAGCSAPLGVHASREGANLVAHAVYSPEDGILTRARIERVCASREAAEAAGRELAAMLQAAGTAAGAAR
ncbi:MAG TPA: hydroxymethylbilane synthase [Candidatus Nitrosotalea sp.]|nr:hydroxymethylbilane synthase [Candidatus Nitrosotalea sp.]